VAKCPQCSAELNRLVFVRNVMETLPIYTENGVIMYGEPEYHDLKNFSEFECPYCFTKIADTEDQAAEFLGLRSTGIPVYIQ
jgi:hypothetical protein